MVYCTKCGTKNEEDASWCVKCGANLTGRPTGRPKEPEEECFGLPHGGAIVGVIIAVIIIVVGLSWVPGLIPPDMREATEPVFWPLILIIFGILIIAGTMYRLSRR